MQPFDTRRSLPGRPLRRAAVVLALAALASLALIVAGCGSGSSSPGVAQVATATSTTQSSPSGGSQGSGSTSDNPVAFSACMRSHGVPNFPDPKVTGEGVSVRIPDSSSPQFKSALKTCQKLLPNGGVPTPAEQAQERTRMLKFSACMRAHGVPNFPDPTFSAAGAGLQINPSSGINRNSPRFEAAKKACSKLLTGAPR